jgi:hypothetical protein
MTSKPSPVRPTGEAELTRFLQDWTSLWRGELQAQHNDPEGMAGATEMWRAAMTVWTDAIARPPARTATPRDPAFGEWALSEWAGTPRAQTAAAASDAGDDAVECLARRIDELEARIAQLETARRRRR